ncbi:helix-turn-helix domain-containing protein [Chromobacterium violaceum]|uniref:HTH cro/C1-type domain-containing protein n=1 Tax=Chromobacterium violaceum TaxID=536 RepID=A0A202B5N1_CHRVL|nr:helix-turn-helix transcriptional regulator [Chromobacterium violaceum]OVE46712.1 hypothetical protein CBW21_17605 [Chromobacterium violaceum]
MQTFHDRLNAAILASGLTFAAVAHACHVDRSTLYRWRTSHMPDSNQIATLAACLNVTTAHLRDGAPVDPEQQRDRHIIFALTDGLPREDLAIIISMIARLRALHQLHDIE